jgi:hypothetical protein
VLLIPCQRNLLKMTRTPFTKAEALFEQYDFSGARQSYMDASLATEPTDADLTNLFLAEKYEKLSFFRELCDLYPGALHVLLAAADYEAEAGQLSQALALYGQLLDWQELSEKDKAKVRLHRFGANCKRSGPDVDTLAADFTYLWNVSEDSVRSTHEMRQLLLTILFKEANHARFMPFLEGLVERRALDEEAKAFIRAKIGLIERLEAITAFLE